ncbi:MAG: nickel pincer cofactor biosynthesis protein LarB [bacterium]|nr:nickel pincer cofactor biosynthesis protein LarB [bacterium]
MESKQIKKLLEEVKEGKLGIEEALDKLRFLPYEELGATSFARIDHHRALRRGFPEVIFGLGKKKEDVLEITKSMLKQKSNILITRASEELYDAVHKIDARAKYNPLAGTITIIQSPAVLNSSLSPVLIITAGTSDIPVAEESAVVVELMGIKTEKLYDVGVAGIHRLLDQKEKITQASVIIVVAGMEGALASVVGGLVDVPIIAVPTSVGYGTSFKGLAALLTMLNSCVPGIVVVNIDNGFGAGYFAGMITKRMVLL